MMEKLNNNGWGLGVMIGFLCVFAIFIIVISILAYHLGVANELPIPLQEKNQIGYIIGK